MKKLIYLSIFLSFYLSINLNSQVSNSKEIHKDKGIQRNASFNLDELKVRWKKAALENCTGVPCVVAPTFTCGTSTITDIDNNSYNTVEIGTQCWTKENLKVTKYSDGTLIPLDATETSSSDGTSLTWQNWDVGRYTIYANEAISGTNATNYGFLYNWYAAKGVVTTGSTTYKNLCPAGWHVPTDSEWSTLIQRIDNSALATTTGNQSTTAGALMKENSNLWTGSAPRNNASGFTGRPSGYRDNFGSFEDVRFYVFFWSATDDGSVNGGFRGLSFNNGNVSRNFANKSYGYSIRCLKD
jgi:uncharacterized protein (TIGR02145 family)